MSVAKSQVWTNHLEWKNVFRWPYCQLLSFNKLLFLYHHTLINRWSIRGTLFEAHYLVCHSMKSTDVMNNINFPLADCTFPAAKSLKHLNYCHFKYCMCQHWNIIHWKCIKKSKIQVCCEFTPPYAAPVWQGEASPLLSVISQMNPLLYV